jgi:threonyl-tRNA synthetase
MLARALFTSRFHATKRLKPTRFTTTLAPFFRSYTPSTPAMAPKAKKDEGSGRPLEMTPPPDYFATRNAIFDKRKAERDQWVAEQPREEIEITLASGDVKKGTSWETTPGNIAREISKSLFERTVISRVDGELWDLERPFEKSGKLELLDFDHPEGKKVFWHSSAHILGEACERHYGCALCIGPPVDDGFYYEMSLPDGAAVSHADYKPLKQVAEKAIKEKQPFERLELSKEDLLEMFAYNKYKQHIIQDKIPDGTRTTVYRCGPLIDLCRGPHVPHTGRIKAFDIMKNSASYFLGDAKNDSLQRIYGVSFPDKAVSWSIYLASRTLTNKVRLSPTTSTCLRRRPSVITARSDRSRSSSSSTRCRPVLPSSCPTA